MIGDSKSLPILMIASEGLVAPPGYSKEIQNTTAP